MLTIKDQIAKVLTDRPGTRNKSDNTKALRRRTNDSNALSGNPRIARIFVRLIETPTKISPVNVADAPAIAM